MLEPIIPSSGNPATIETMRHSLTVRLLALKKANPTHKMRIDSLIMTIKRECATCASDEAEIVVLQRYVRLYCK